jgi:thioredoxin reductase
LGAGPIGIEAALHAKQAGFDVVVYERGDPGEHLGHWGHVRLFTPFSWNVSPAGLELIRREHPQHQLPGPNDFLTGHDFRDAYLVPLTMTSLLGDLIRPKSLVVRIGRGGVLKTDPADDPRRATNPFRLLIRDDKGAERNETADIVFDCTGNYARHAWLGDGGIPAVGELAAEKMIVYGVDDVLGKKKQSYAGKSTIVVGGGYSAATTVVALAKLAEENQATWVIWLARGPRTTPLMRNHSDPLKERERLAAKANNLATRGDGNLEFHANTLVDDVVCHGPDKGFRVVARCNGKPMVWEVDRLIANIGFTADDTISRELHTAEFRDGRIAHPEPNYFCLGMKSVGRDSNFLLKTGIEQVRDAIAKLAKKTGS